MMQSVLLKFLTSNWHTGAPRKLRKVSSRMQSGQFCRALALSCAEGEGDIVLFNVGDVDPWP